MLTDYSVFARVVSTENVVYYTGKNSTLIDYSGKDVWTIPFDNVTTIVMVTTYLLSPPTSGIDS